MSEPTQGEWGLTISAQAGADPKSDSTLSKIKSITVESDDPLANGGHPIAFLTGPDAFKNATLFMAAPALLAAAKGLLAKLQQYDAVDRVVFGEGSDPATFEEFHALEFAAELAEMTPEKAEALCEEGDLEDFRDAVQ